MSNEAKSSSDPKEPSQKITRYRSPKVVLKEEDFPRIEAMAARGLSYQDIARIYGVSDDTLAKYRADYPQLNAVIELGRAKAKEVMTDKAYDAALKAPEYTYKWLSLRYPEDWAQKSKDDLDKATRDRFRNLPHDQKIETLKQALKVLEESNVDQTAVETIATTLPDEK